MADPFVKALHANVGNEVPSFANTKFPETVVNAGPKLEEDAV
jgi:hypothetical protein